MREACSGEKEDLSVSILEARNRDRRGGGWAHGCSGFRSLNNRTHFLHTCLSGACGSLSSGYTHTGYSLESATQANPLSSKEEGQPATGNGFKPSEASHGFTGQVAPESFNYTLDVSMLLPYTHKGYQNRFSYSL